MEEQPLPKRVIRVQHPSPSRRAYIQSEYDRLLPVAQKHHEEHPEDRDRIDRMDKTFFDATRGYVTDIRPDDDVNALVSWAREHFPEEQPWPLIRELGIVGGGHRWLVFKTREDQGEFRRAYAQALREEHQAWKAFDKFLGKHAKARSGDTEAVTQRERFAMKLIRVYYYLGSLLDALRDEGIDGTETALGLPQGLSDEHYEEVTGLPRWMVEAAADYIGSSPAIEHEFAKRARRYLDAAAVRDELLGELEDGLAQVSFPEGWTQPPPYDVEAFAEDILLTQRASYGPMLRAHWANRHRYGIV
ncbi:MAG TPA: hypothetical protein VIY27_06740 [Myxococcota bacterium]